MSSTETPVKRSKAMVEQLKSAQIFKDYQEAFRETTGMPLVGVTRTEPLRELVWSSRKDPDHERKEIHDRAEDPDIAGGR